MGPGFKSRCRRHMRIKLLLVLFFALRGFSPDTAVKNQHLKISIRFVEVLPLKLSLAIYLLTYLYLLRLLRSSVLHYNHIWLLSSFSVPLFSFSLYDLQSPSSNCHTGSNDISNPHSHIPACTAEDFLGQGTGKSSKDIGFTFLSSTEDLPDDLNILLKIWDTNPYKMNNFLTDFREYCVFWSISITD